MQYLRWFTRAGVAGSALAAVLGGEILLARNRSYLSDVDFVIDRTAAPDGVTGRPVELRVLGDSTAAGVGADSVAGALPVQLAERVATAIGQPVHVVGHGVSGARTADLPHRQLPHVDGDADVIVIVVGANDVVHVTPPWRLWRQTRELVHAARARSVPVVFGGVPRFRGLRALAPPLRQVTAGAAYLQRQVQRRAIADLSGVTFVDIAALAGPRFAGRPETMSVDAYHPSAVGYGLWADALAPAVVAALHPVPHAPTPLRSPARP